MHAEHGPIEIVSRLALIVAGGGPSVSAVIQLARIPKQRARLAALGLGIIAATGVSLSIEDALNGHVALDALLGGPLVGLAAHAAYEGVRTARRGVGR